MNNAIAPIAAALDTLEKSVASLKKAGASEEQIKAFLQDQIGQLYKGFVEPFKILFPILEELSAAAGTDVAKALANAMPALERITASFVDEPIYALIRKNLADQRMLKLKANMEAGFTREEAMAILLRDPTFYDGFKKGVSASQKAKK